MTTDWWTQSTTASTQTFNTPQRPHISTSTSSGWHPRTRSSMAGDDLDEEDAKMAEGIRFLPSFANSPAGKLALGSPASSSSPPAGRKSPNARFNSSVISTGESSPRHTRQRPQPVQPPIFDDDMPPTASLRDINDTPVRSNVITSPTRLPTPPSLISNPTQTSLHVFGPPPSLLQNLQPYLSQSGPIVSYKPGPEGSNWYVVTYTTPQAAGYALRRHGEIVGGKYMIGFRVFDGTSERGYTATPVGNGPDIGGGDGGEMIPRGPGTPLRPISRAIIKPKINGVVSTGNGATGGEGGGVDEYSWEEGEPVGRWNKAAEWLFGR